MVLGEEAPGDEEDPGSWENSEENYWDQWLEVIWKQRVHCFEALLTLRALEQSKSAPQSLLPLEVSK